LPVVGLSIREVPMSKDFARKFYSSQAWNNCREAYMNKVHHLCERCLAKGIYKPAEIVHHKIELTPDNIGNPRITLSHENLEAVCRECHAALHGGLDGGRKRRYFVAPNGSVIIKENEKNF